MATVTLSIPDELKKRMDKRPGIKWSEIFRRMIVSKIDQLKKLEGDRL